MTFVVNAVPIKKKYKMVSMSIFYWFCPKIILGHPEITHNHTGFVYIYTYFFI